MKVLRDTRMPISVIFENLEYGSSIEVDHRELRCDPPPNSGRLGNLRPRALVSTSLEACYDVRDGREY